jgi:hypothetical protein
MECYYDLINVLLINVGNICFESGFRVISEPLAGEITERSHPTCVRDLGKVAAIGPNGCIAPRRKHCNAIHGYLALNSCKQVSLLYYMPRRILGSGNDSTNVSFGGTIPRHGMAPLRDILDSEST